MFFSSGFRAKCQRRVTSVAFQSILREQIRNLPKILKSVKIIQYYSPSSQSSFQTDPNSILFNLVLICYTQRASGNADVARVTEKPESL